MIVFRPNVRAYMPGVDIVNRPVVAEAASDWWLAGGSIDAGDVIFYGTNVSDSETVSSTYTGNFTYAVRANFPGADAVDRDFFISSTDGAKDYTIRNRSDGVIRLLTPGNGTSSGALSGDMVVFVTVDETGTSTAKIYFDDGATEESSANLNSNTGEILLGQKWFDSVAFGANASAVHVSSIVLDATQRADLYTEMMAL